MKLEVHSNSEGEFSHILREYLEGEREINSLLSHPVFIYRAQRMCSSIQRDREAGKELFQEACLRILTHQNELLVREADIESADEFLVWFYFFARNITRSNYRRNRRRIATIPVDPWPVEEHHVAAAGIDPEARRLLGEFLESVKALPEKKRRAVEMWISGYSTREIAKFLVRSGVRCTHVTVHSWIMTTLKTFREEVKKSTVA